MPNKLKRIIDELTLDEISGVDKPAMESARAVIIKNDDRINELEEAADEQFHRVLEALEQQKAIAGRDVKALRGVQENAMKITSLTLDGGEAPQGLREFLQVLNADIQALEAEENERVRERANATSLTRKSAQIEIMANRLAKSATPSREDALILKRVASDTCADLMAKFDSVDKALADEDVQRLYAIAQQCDVIAAKGG